MTEALCFVDCETTGLHPDREAWEIAMIRREPTGEEFEASFFVDVELDKADLIGLNIGRFFERHPRGRNLSGRQADTPVPGNSWTGFTDGYFAAEAILRFTHGAHLVGAVPNFDAETFAVLLRRHGLRPTWHYHLVDVEALAVGYLHGIEQMGYENDGFRLPGLPWNSDQIGEMVGVPALPEELRHTAMGDTYWARAVWDAITEPRFQATAEPSGQGVWLDETGEWEDADWEATDPWPAARLVAVPLDEPVDLDKHDGDPYRIPENVRVQIAANNSAAVVPKSVEQLYPSARPANLRPGRSNMRLSLDRTAE